MCDAHRKEQPPPLVLLNSRRQWNRSAKYLRQTFCYIRPEPLNVCTAPEYMLCVSWSVRASPTLATHCWVNARQSGGSEIYPVQKFKMN